MQEAVVLGGQGSGGGLERGRGGGVGEAISEEDGVVGDKRGGHLESAEEVGAEEHCVEAAAEEV